MIGIIPAAGRGIRFKELGKHYSKTILPYKEKPILIHQIEWLEQHGCNDIRVVLNHAEQSVIDILSIYNKRVTICHQEERNGLSGAIFSALNKSDDDNVLVLLGDLIVNDTIVPSTFTKNFISVQDVPDYSRWCMVEILKNKEFIFHDKPTERPNTTWAVSGVYHFVNSKKLYDYLDVQLADDRHKVNGEFQISTVLQWVADNSQMHKIDIDLIDFGTLEEYLENRSVKNSRSFNDIEIKDRFITKSSEKEREKLIKEYNWFMNLPDNIQVHTPRIFDKNLFSKRTSYTMEKILSPSLREIYLFLDNTEETWDAIVNAMFSQLHDMQRYGQQNTFMESAVQKTKTRVQQIEIPIENKLVNKFIKEFEEISSTLVKNSLMHGDYCFSNLLYDFNGNITMIDPRGELFGSHYYDVAKICHSVLYDYDFVDAELYLQTGDTYKLYNNGKEKIKELFIKQLEMRYTPQEVKYIKYITASLFLSMIPLHSHNINNQKIYYDIFKNIYKGLENE